MAIITVYSKKSGFPINIDEGKLSLYQNKYTTTPPQKITSGAELALRATPITSTSPVSLRGTLKKSITTPLSGSITNFNSLMRQLSDYTHRERPTIEQTLSKYSTAGIPITTPSAIGTVVGRETEQRLGTIQNIFQSSLDLIQEQDKTLERQRQENFDFGRQMFQLILGKPELFSGVTAEEFESIKNGVVPTELIQKITQAAQQPLAEQPEIPSISEQLQAREKGFIIEEGKIVPEQLRDISQLPDVSIQETPEEYKWMIESQAKRLGIPASLISAVISQESGFNPQAQNITDKETSYGLGQINLLAHPQITKEQAQNPQFAVRFVAERLKSMIDKYGLYEGVQAYNTPAAIGSLQLKNYADSILGKISTIQKPIETQDKEQKKEFWSAVKNSVSSLQRGEEWGTVWNRLKLQFPNTKDEEIDTALGIEWRKEGSFEEFKQKQFKDTQPRQFELEAEIWKEIAANPDIDNETKKQWIMSKGFDPEDFNIY